MLCTSVTLLINKTLHSMHSLVHNICTLYIVYYAIEYVVYNTQVGVVCIYLLVIQAIIEPFIVQKVSFIWRFTGTLGILYIPD